MTDPLHTEPGVVVTEAVEWLRAISTWLLETDNDMKLPNGILDTDPLDIADALTAAEAESRDAVEDWKSEAAFYRHEAGDLAAQLTVSLQEVGRLRAERDFLLARASKAGSCSFGGGRWTGMSSNALVTVAFGGEDDCLPSDSSDLAACYRTMLRLPRHLLSDKVWEQLEDGERYVGSKYPDDIAWAKEAAEWPENARAALTASEAPDA